ncbi:MAG: carboxymuconolactone decarboxylase family protein [Sinimarinibacterium flocculans]|uniref:carboxymuconolactone decarboxylase family protein n=1 Tax=Sinimarinibacterium flocculans TaxID=985250 RepID=UPI003C4D09DB
MRVDSSESLRIEPLKPEQWDSEVLDALGALPAGLNFVLKSRQAGEALPRGSNVLGMLARHPPLAKAFLTFNAHIAGGTQLNARTRELAIIRISWLKRCEYELVQHLILGRRAGLAEDELDRLQQHAAPGPWAPADGCVVAAIDEWHAESRIGDATWAQLQPHFTTTQLLDLLFLLGCYSTLAMALNSIRLPLEPSVSRA